MWMLVNCTFSHVLFWTICYLPGDCSGVVCAGVRIASAGIFARLRLDGAHCTERRGAASTRLPLGEILLSVAIWSGGPSLASLASLALSPLSIWDHWRMLLWPGPGPAPTGIIQHGGNWDIHRDRGASSKIRILSHYALMTIRSSNT